MRGQVVVLCNDFVCLRSGTGSLRRAGRDRDLSDHGPVIMRDRDLSDHGPVTMRSQSQEKDQEKDLNRHFVRFIAPGQHVETSQLGAVLSFMGNGNRPVS